MANVGTYSQQPLQVGLGGLDDSVRIVINAQQVLIAEGWDIHEGVLSQPSTWSITIGSGDLAATILKMVQPGPKYFVQVFVGKNQQQSGYIDAVECSQPERGATTVTIRGRDAMAILQDSYVSAAIAANVTTYAQLCWFAMQQVGLVPSNSNTIDPKYLVFDNSANRNIKSGVPIAAIAPHRTVEQILDGAGLTNAGTAGVVCSPPQAKLHETWHHFIRRHIDRAGLMFWAAADGTFVLAAPDGNQSPSYLLRRKTGQPTASDRANVVAMHYADDRTHRHSEIIVYGKGGGKSVGRVKSKGAFTDEEMTDSGYDQAMVFRDANTHSAAEGIYFARRKIAEERRAGWRLEYTISGNTLPWAGAAGGQGVRAVVVPDTVVQVDDDELALQGNFYIDSVNRRRSSSGTTTQLKLVRLDDLLYGADDE